MEVDPNKVVNYLVSRIAELERKLAYALAAIPPPEESKE